MKRPSALLAISLVALFFSLVGVGLAAKRNAITSTSQIAPSVPAQLREANPSGPRVTPAQLADQRSFELYEAKQAQAQTAQCFANHVPDAKCTVLRIAPAIGSAPVSCGSGGCSPERRDDNPPRLRRHSRRVLHYESRGCRDLAVNEQVQQRICVPRVVRIATRRARPAGRAHLRRIAGRAKRFVRQLLKVLDQILLGLNLQLLDGLASAAG